MHISPPQELLGERAALKEALDQARRERDYLASENSLLRQELLGAPGLKSGGCDGT